MQTSNIDHSKAETFFYHHYIWDTQFTMTFICHYRESSALILYTVNSELIPNKYTQKPKTQSIICGGISNEFTVKIIAWEMSNEQWHLKPEKKNDHNLHHGFEFGIWMFAYYHWRVNLIFDLFEFKYKRYFEGFHWNYQKFNKMITIKYAPSPIIS